VVYLAGFATIPDDLTDACRRQLAAMYSAWKLAKQGRDIVRSENVGGWVTTYLERHGLLPEVAAVCRGYRAERL